MKVCFDYICAFLILLILSPLIIVCAFLIWRQDYKSPFYLGQRIGLHGKPFKMIKFRSMVQNADKTGVDSTSASDPRITAIGHFIRRYKIDEIPQLFNILRGEMSFVGPRPNVKRETDLYSKEEKELLEVKPGITDIASIVFSDEGEILKDKEDPDIAYNQLIRPWKSRLGLFYIANMSFLLDLKIIWLTFISVFSRKRALEEVSILLTQMKADKKLIEISLRKEPLKPTPPPGFDSIIVSRQVETK